MKPTLPFSSMLASSCCSVCAATAGALPNETDARESPFGCDSLALDPTSRKRHFDVLLPELAAKCIAVEALTDGYEFTLPSDKVTFDHVVEWMRGERLCCPFFEISLRVTPGLGPLKLRVTGQPGAKAFMESLGARWLSVAVGSK